MSLHPVNTLAANKQSPLFTQPSVMSQSVVFQVPVHRQAGVSSGLEQPLNPLVCFNCLFLFSNVHVNVMVHPLDAGIKRKNWYKVGPLVQVQITCWTSAALLSFENYVSCLCFKSMHFQRKFCQTLFVLTTVLSTDQPHLLATRATLTFAVWVAAGGCGTQQPALALMSLSTMTLAVLCSWTSVCLCVTGWKNWKGPGNMRAIGRAPSRCDITLLTPPFFSVSTRDILQARDGENKTSHQHCDYYYFCSVTGSTTITCTTAFFHISILSTDLISDGEWQLLRDYELLRGTGWEGGEGGCRTFASWHFLHFFMDCFVFFGYKERDRGDSRTCL